MNESRDSARQSTLYGLSLPEPLPTAVEVAIVGGGIVGAAAAYQLAKRGVDVLLFEKDTIAGEQSGRNWGFVRQQGRDPAELPLMIASNRLWRQMSEELEADIEWTQGGNLALTEDEATAQKYEDWAKIGAELGLGTRTLTMDGIREILPGVQHTWVAGMLTPSDGHANPVKATTALANAARRFGACLVTGCAVTSIETAGRRVVGVQTELGRVACGAVVCAAGRWSHQLLRTAGLDLPQSVVRETVVATESLPPVTRAGVWAQSLSFRQAADGSVVLAGGGAVDVDVTRHTFRHFRMFFPTFLRNRSHFRINVGLETVRSFRPPFDGNGYRAEEPAVNQTVAARCVQTFQEWFPHLGPVRVQRVWAGLIDGTPDLIPVIDRLERPEGLVVATGLSGHGFAMGPILGVIVADLLTKGEAPGFDLIPFRFNRFAEGTFSPPRNIL